jgi:hypothetical protein
MPLGRAGLFAAYLDALKKKRPQRGGELGPQGREECRRDPTQF